MKTPCQLNRGKIPRFSAVASDAMLADSVEHIVANFVFGHKLRQCKAGDLFCLARTLAIKPAGDKGECLALLL